MVDPYSSITSALSQIGNDTLNVFQVNFSPIDDNEWKSGAEKIIKIMEGKLPKFLKKIVLNYNLGWLKLLAFPFYLLGKFISLLLPKADEETEKPEDN
jgi:hypothetical protein